MDEEHKQSPSTALSVLQRLERLDRLLQVLGKKQSLLARDPSTPAVKRVEEKGGRDQAQDQCKTMSSALEEVHHKGTLMERVAMLEDRVLQLSLEIEVGNTSSKASYSAIPMTSEKTEHESGSVLTAAESASSERTQQEKPNPLSAQGQVRGEACVVGKRSGKRWSVKMRRRWLCGGGLDGDVPTSTSKDL